MTLPGTRLRRAASGKGRSERQRAASPPNSGHLCLRSSPKGPLERRFVSVHLSSRCQSSVSVSLIQRLPGLASSPSQGRCRLPASTPIVSNTRRASVHEICVSGLVSGLARRTQVAVLFPVRGLLLRLGLRGRACFGCYYLSLLFLRRHLILLDRRVRCPDSMLTGPARPSPDARSPFQQTATAAPT